MRTLGQVQAALGLSLIEMIEKVRTQLHAEPYTQAELASILGLEVAGIAGYGVGDVISLPLQYLYTNSFSVWLLFLFLELQSKWLSPSTVTQESFLPYIRWV